MLTLCTALAGCAGAPPQIVSLDPSNGRSGIPVDAPVTVAFDHPVDRTSVSSHFRVDPAIAGCAITAAFASNAGACRIVWAADSSRFSLEHQGALFAPGTSYLFSLDAGVADTGGVVNGLDHHWTLATAAAPQVQSISPGDGAGDVDVSSEIVVTFSAPMRAAATAAAITLSPSPPGTRVVANTRDPSRFVVLPGSLLAAGATYTVRVGAGAVGDHGAPVAAPASARFVTGTLRGAAHALVLARRPGESPTVVELTGVGAAIPGEPAPAATVLEAPRCAAARCGDASRGSPLEAYEGAALSPDGTTLALVVRDQTRAAARPHLEVVALPQIERRVIAFDASFPAWAPGGGMLAFGSGSRVLLWNASLETTTALPDGDPLQTPPRWSADGSTLALQVGAAGHASHVDLCDISLRIRYPVPAVADPASSPVINSDGTALALRVDGARPGTLLIRLRTAEAAPRRLGDDLTPVAWTDPGTLLLVQRPAAGDPGLVRLGVAGGELDRLAGGPAPGYLASVVSDPRGRSIGYLTTDSAGVVQAWAANADGSNPAPLTAFAPDSHYEAFSVSFTG